MLTYCRVDSLLRNQEAVAAWHDIGLERLFVGIDATTASLLDSYNKRCSVDQIEEALEVARKIGIEIFAQFVVPTTFSRQDFVRLRRFVEYHRIEYPSFTVLTPIPGTALLKEDFSGVTEMMPNGRPNWSLFDTDNPVTATLLPRDEFVREYTALWEYFSGAYSKHRDRRPMHLRSQPISELPAAANQPI